MNRLIKALLLPAALLTAGAVAAQSSAQTISGRSALCFIENNGAITDQYGKPRCDIQYSLTGTEGLNIFIGNGSLHYQFSEANNTTTEKTRGHAKHSAINSAPVPYDLYRLDVTLEGSDPLAQVITGAQQEYRELYFHPGSGGQTALSFDRITYRNIYKNIDWVLYLRNGHLEYDFVVRPGGNVNDIRIRYDGASELQKTGNGVMASTPMGTIRESGLHSYLQESGQEVACNFAASGNHLGFATAEYKGTLVIDPTLEWGTYYGGTNARGRIVACGDSGSVYVAGYTSSVTGIATTGAYQAAYTGGDDVFLAKFDSSGARIWGTYYGGSGNDEAYGIATDSAGNVYLSGLTTSTDGIATPGSHQATNGGGIGDVFLAKFNRNGQRLWGTYYGGSGSEISTGACTDKAGNIYITGRTYSTDSIATPGTYKVTGGGDLSDGFIAKFTGSGALTWATYFGGPDDDEPQGIAVDDSENVYITGGTGSTDSIATPSAYQMNYRSYDDDAFVAKFSNTGMLRWGTYYGANGSNSVQAIICDGAGNVYVTGSTSCLDSMSTPGSHQATLIGPANAYLAKFSSAGAIQWGTYYGTDGDGGNSIAFNAAGNICMTGSTTSITGISTAGASQGLNAGGQDAFLAQFSPGGALLWATYYGGPSSDYAYHVACDGIGNMYITGMTTSASGIATHGAFDTVCDVVSINENAFLAKFDTATAHPTVTPTANRATESFTVYPNPASDVLYVSLTGMQPATIQLTILNALGQCPVSTTLSPAQGKSVIDLSMLPPGVYVCILENGTNRYYHQFTIAR